MRIFVCERSGSNRNNVRPEIILQRGAEQVGTKRASPWSSKAVLKMLHYSANPIEETWLDCSNCSFFDFGTLDVPSNEVDKRNRMRDSTLCNGLSPTAKPSCSDSLCVTLAKPVGSPVSLPYIAAQDAQAMR